MITKFNQSATQFQFQDRPDGFWEPVEDDLQSYCQSSSIQKGMSIQTKSILLKQGT